MKWYREPLVHFLVIGAALFGIFALGNGLSAPAPSRYQVVITPGLIQNLQVSFQRAEQRPPADAELSKLIDDYVHEEILVREARALGLDQDDLLIRSHLSQKMEYYLEDSVTTPPPTNEQLTAFLQKHPASFQNPDGTLPTLTAIHDKVVAAWAADQSRQTVNAAYEKIRAQYKVDIEKPPPGNPANATAAPTKSGAT